MKKIFSIFLFLGAFLFFTACSKDASINEVPKVQLNIYLSQSARSASLLPKYDFSQEAYTFKLIANSNSGECFEWGLTFNSVDKSFTSAQDNSILLNQGTWSFTLSVYHNDVLCLVGKNENVNISESYNTLIFNLSQANEDDIASGFIDVTINFPPSAGVTKVSAYLIDNDESKIEFSANSNENKIITSDANNTVTYKYSLASGNYILSFDFYQDETKIANYMLPVLIASGATSYYNGGDETSLTLTIDNFNTIYTLTLIVDETYYSYSYTKNQKLILPTLEKEDFNFEGWLKNGDETETLVSEIPSGSISGDVTYTAKFTKKEATETEILLTSSSSPLSTGTYYVENNMSIEDPIEISGDVVIYAKNDSTITSYSGVFSLNDEASLTLGKEDADGVLTITNTAPYMAAIQTTTNNINITINDKVKFTGCQKSYQISFISSGDLTINGGEFVENQYTPLYVNNSSAKLTIKGGNISNNSIPSGNYAINVQAGSLAITGGTIKDNLVNSENHGASIYFKNTEGNSFTISNESQTAGNEFTNNIIEGEEKALSSSGTYNIGDLYSENDTPIGVVFETGDNYIKVLALDELEAKSLVDGSWIDPDLEYECIIATDEDDGSNNMTAYWTWYDYMSGKYVKFTDENHENGFYQAYNYSVLEDGSDINNWYIPAINELYTIMENIETINSTLSSHTELTTGKHYWSSTIDASSSYEKAYCISSSLTKESYALTSTNYNCRAVRKISF